MKTTLKTLTLAVLMVALVAVSGLDQGTFPNSPTRTTLGAALGAGTQTTLVTVASTTGITASTASVQTFIMVEQEIMRVRTVNSSTVLTVVRAISGDAVAHVSGRSVTYGPGGGTWSTSGDSNGVFLTSGKARPSGTCTRTKNQYLPLFASNEPYRTYDCLGGYWVEGSMPNAPDATPLVLACNVPIGSVAYGSLGTTTTDVSGTEWSSSIMVPKTGWITGIQILQGNTAGTDSIVAILRDSAGNLLANSSSTGTALSGADTFLSLAFTSPRFVVAAPGGTRYFIGVQGNGSATGAIRTIATNTFRDVVTTSVTGTAGVIPATYAVPTTFTATKGPIGCLYY